MNLGELVAKLYATLENHPNLQEDREFEGADSIIGVLRQLSFVKPLSSDGFEGVTTSALKRDSSTPLLQILWAVSNLWAFKSPPLSSLRLQPRTILVFKLLELRKRILKEDLGRILMLCCQPTPF